MKAIEDYLKKSVQEGVFPGCNCLIIHNGVENYYSVGLRSIEPLQLNNNETLYDLASLSKVVGTMPAILRLIYMNKISYNTTVQHIIKEFENPDITIFHLLTHTSGLPADLTWKLTSTKKEMLETICAYSKNVTPSKQVIYSDLGYMLL